LVPILLLASVRIATAQKADTDAQALFDQAKALMKDGKLAEACQAFEASDHASPATTTLLNAAACRDKNGQLATAWGLFREAERRSRGTDDKLHGVATTHADALAPRLSRLTIVVTDRAPGLVVSRDGATIDAGAWNLALPIDGGRYTITATAQGRES